MIEVVISFLIGLALPLVWVWGYWDGRAKQSGYEEPLLTKGLNHLKQVVKSKPKPGIIQSPTQEDIIRRDNPKLAETEEAMSEVFEDLNVKTQ